MTSLSSPTVSVCIPAFNEEGGIGCLLRQILDQNRGQHRLAEILVASDGSTDGTVAEARRIADARIRVIDDDERRGKAFRVNELLASATGDVVVLLDADVVLQDRSFLDTLVRDFDAQEYGLAAPAAQPLPPTSWVNRSLGVGAAIVTDVGAAWRPDEGVYLQFRGCCLVLGREFARRLRLPEGVVNDDAYVYLMARRLGYRPRALPQAIVWYLLPATVRDHRGQATRHRLANAELARWFPQDVVRREYDIPHRLLLWAVLRQAVHRPVHLMGYLLLTVVASMGGRLMPHAHWTPASSTKPAAGSARDRSETVVIGGMR